ncbi:hypothetical protein BDZ89DRAFT_1071891 [Hymenopellis radicata]|nr:hypothetical protein BDZ89DRAFT_1071891 [Hymenopellis radicata]
MSSPLAALKNELLDFNPPSLERGTDEAALPSPSSPLEFFDYHVSNNLILKRVKLLPTLVDDLALLVTSKYKDALDRIPLDLFAYDEYYYASAENSDARAVHFIREIGISMTCAHIASCVLIHPDEPRIKPVLHWGVSRSLEPPSDSEQDMDRFLIQHLALRVADHVVGTHDSHSRPSYPAPSAATQTRMTALYENSRVLTVAMLFDTSAHHLLADMEDLAAQETFSWELASECTGKQIPAPASMKHIDAPKYPWTIPAASLASISDALDSSMLRRTDRRNASIRRAPEPGHVKPVARTTSAKDGYVPRAKDYVQRAWANAVKLDSSTMIWDCGNFLRIGIRHRESQTLYLSDLIDVRTCTDPAYGKIWLGLHLAIVSDALERLPILERQRHLPRGVKRTFNDDGAPAAQSAEKRKQATKKRRITAENSVRSLLSSHIAAFYFQTSQYDSPAPALFYHADDEIRDSYSPSEYVMIVLDSRLGTGGTGTVFRACIEPDASSSKPKYCAPFVVKFAYSSKDVVRLRHEYAVRYGIPRLLGFYEAFDQDDMAALIVAHAGRPLGELLDENHKIYLKPSEIESLKETLDKIHAAGAVHRDIRSWNMMVDSSGDMFIADFDRASFNGSEHDLEKETQRFQAFVAGEYVDARPVVGDDDLASSYSDYIEDTEELKQDEEMTRYFKRYVAVHWDTRDPQFAQLGHLTSPFVVENRRIPDLPSERKGSHKAAPRRRGRTKRKLAVTTSESALPATTARPTAPKAHECESFVRLERCVSGHSLLFEGYLQQRSSSRVGMGQRFIVKVARGPGQYGKAKLEHEYQTYQRLAGLMSDGLPRIYGFYETVDGFVQAGILFMEKVGKPSYTIESSEISPDFRLTIENWLRDLHDAGCVHNDLVDNILVNDSPPWRFCVVSWKAAKFFSEEDRLKEEVIKQMKDEMDGLRKFCFAGNV